MEKETNNQSEQIGSPIGQGQDAMGVIVSGTPGYDGENLGESESGATDAGSVTEDTQTQPLSSEQDSSIAGGAESSESGESASDAETPASDKTDALDVLFPAATDETGNDAEAAEESEAGSNQEGQEAHTTDAVSAEAPASDNPNAFVEPPQA